MRVDRLESSPPLGHTTTSWQPLTQSVNHAISWLRSRQWYGEATTGIALFVQLGLLLSMAAISGLILGIIF